MDRVAVEPPPQEHGSQRDQFVVRFEAKRPEPAGRSRRYVLDHEPVRYGRGRKERAVPLQLPDYLLDALEAGDPRRGQPPLVLLSLNQAFPIGDECLEQPFCAEGADELLEAPEVLLDHEFERWHSFFWRDGAER